MFDGRISVVADEGDSGRILSKTTLDGACLAAPSAAHGRVFVQTKKRLYCFGSDLPAPAFVAKPQEELKHESTEPSAGLPVVLQVVPSEFALNPEPVRLSKSTLLTGRVVESRKSRKVWLGKNGSLQPPKFNPKSMLKWTIPVSLLPIWGPSFLRAPRVSKGPLNGVTRGRILQDLPYEVNFEQGFDLKNTSTDGIAFSYPPCLGLEPECVGRSKRQEKTIWREILWTAFFSSGPSTSSDTRT